MIEIGISNENEYKHIGVIRNRTKLFNKLREAILSSDEYKPKKKGKDSLFETGKSA